MEPVGVGAFSHDGRGPELLRAHWDRSGTILRAIDYRNPTDAPDRDRHVVVVRCQVVMITPEEVIDYTRNAFDSESAAAFDLGRSAWWESFAPRHLERCRHYQLYFYDHLFDLICEGLEFRDGLFTAAAPPGPADLLATLEAASRSQLDGSGWERAVATHYADPEVEEVRRQAALTGYRLGQGNITAEQAAEYWRLLAKRLRSGES